MSNASKRWIVFEVVDWERGAACNAKALMEIETSLACCAIQQIDASQARRRAPLATHTSQTIVESVRAIRYTTLARFFAK